MTRNRKSEGYAKRIKYLFVLFLGAMIFISSASAFTLPDTAKRQQPPPHPKPKSLKEIWTKINPFKKKNKDGSNSNSQPEVDPKPIPPSPPPPQPQPKPVTPITPKHKPTAKKKKTTTSPDNKKTDKPAQPLI